MGRYLKCSSNLAITTGSYLLNVDTTGHDVGSDKDFLFPFAESIDDVDSLIYF